MKVLDEHKERRLREWAFENACVLILMAILFGITWIVMLAYGVTHHAG